LSGPDAVARAHAQLRGMIVRGVLAPGSELSQVELARRTGVSTTPLREALRRLEAEGLVESRPHRRPRVRPFACDDLDSVYAARAMLEPLALRITVPRMSAGDRSRLRELLAATERAAVVAQQDLRTWERTHHAFHLQLIAGAPRPLRELIETLIARADRYRRIAVREDTPGGREAGDAEHAAIVTACEAGDAARAASVLRTQLVRAARTVGTILVGGIELPALDAALIELGELAEPAEPCDHEVHDRGQPRRPRQARRGDV
jgi:DNA-binding GntR family transcriptional regulator